MSRLCHYRPQNRKGDFSIAMWKPKPAESLSITSSPESIHPAPAIPALEPNPRKPASASHPSAIGKGLIFVGQITGSEALESLFIEGTVEGSINVPGSRVTVGHDGQVTAGIAARDIVVMGTIQGNLTASDRVDMRAGSTITGEASAPRICIEDGAFFNGSLDVRKAGIEPEAIVDLPAIAKEPPIMALVRPPAGHPRIHQSAMSA